MLIDWFTVGAQALNFLLLVWLMKRFLYQPILHAIDAREKLIAAELADADAKKTQAQKERDEFARKNREFDQQRATLLGKATEEAKAEQDRLLTDARRSADDLTAKRQELLKKDALNLNASIVRRTQDEVFAIARKTLTDLAASSLEERACDVFTHRLRTMDDATKAEFKAEPAVIRSAFELPAEQRATIQNALNETFSAEVPVRYETAPDLVSGIELTAGGRKVAWSIAGYLAAMKESVGHVLPSQ